MIKQRFGQLDLVTTITGSRLRQSNKDNNGQIWIIKEKRWYLYAWFEYSLAVMVFQDTLGVAIRGSLVRIFFLGVGSISGDSISISFRFQKYPSSFGRQSYRRASTLWFPLPSICCSRPWSIQLLMVSGDSSS